MREFALHVLDVAHNALQAGASCIRIDVRVDACAGILRMSAADNGVGMADSTLASASSPFFTSRTGRKFGFGLALLEQSVANAGGHLTVQSALGKGTLIIAQYPLTHVNRPPIGDLSGTLFLLISCSDTCRFVVTSLLPDGRERTLDTRSYAHERTPKKAQAVREQLEELFPAGFADPWLDPTYLSHERRTLREAIQCGAQVTAPCR